MAFKQTPNEALAAAVIEMMAMQETFRKTRNTDDLRRVRRLEIKVKKMAEDILHPGQKQPSMFEEAMADVPTAKRVRTPVGQIDPFDPFAPPDPAAAEPATWEFDGELPPSDTEYP